MKKETKIIMRNSLRESIKYISAGLFAGLTVSIMTGQPMLDMSKIESYIFVLLLFLLGIAGLWTVVFSLNIIDIKK